MCASSVWASRGASHLVAGSLVRVRRRQRASLGSCGGCVPEVRACSTLPLHATIHADNTSAGAMRTARCEGHACDAAWSQRVHTERAASAVRQHECNAALPSRPRLTAARQCAHAVRNRKTSEAEPGGQLWQGKVVACAAAFGQQVHVVTGNLREQSSNVQCSSGMPGHAATCHRSHDTTTTTTTTTTTLLACTSSEPHQQQQPDAVHTAALTMSADVLPALCGDVGLDTGVHERQSTE